MLTINLYDVSLIHFVFELFKISILSAIYTTILYFLLRWIVNKNKVVNRLFSSTNKTLVWFMSWAMISVILFAFMYSHYGNHGLGDSYRIPISHHNELRATDSHAYIFIDAKSYTQNIDKFVMTNDFVYGTLDKLPEDKKTSYFVYDLKSKNIETFENETSYNNYLTSKKLDQNTERKEFYYYYDQYWSGWRFFLLP